jgi:hypothetical protein
MRLIWGRHFRLRLGSVLTASPWASFQDEVYVPNVQVLGGEIVTVYTLGVPGHQDFNRERAHEYTGVLLD